MTIKSPEIQENQPPPDINVVSNEDIILNDTQFPYDTGVYIFQ
jgi:hypothetical protein